MLAMARRRAFASSSGSPLLASWDFTSATLGAMTSATFSSTFSGLVFSRASVATVQTAADTIDATPGVDDARFGSLGTAWGRGLVIEEARTNDATYARGFDSFASPGSGAVLTNDYANGPDGQAHATRAEANLGEYSKYDVLSSAARYGTIWLRATSGTSGYRVQMGLTDMTGTAGTTWQRIGMYEASSLDYTPVDTVQAGDGPPLDLLMDFLQAEVGPFPTEAIITSGSPATRSPDLLVATSGASLIDVGRISFYVKFVAKAASVDYPAAQVFWTPSALQYMQIGTGLVTVAGPSASWTSGVSMSWNAYDVVELFVDSGNTLIVPSAKYRVNGGTAISLGSGGTPLGAFSASGAMDLMHYGSANQLNGWLQTMSFYKSGSKPAWV